MPRSRPCRIALAVLASLLLLAGCGDDDEPSSADEPQDDAQEQPGDDEADVDDEDDAAAAPRVDVVPVGEEVAGATPEAHFVTVATHFLSGTESTSPLTAPSCDMEQPIEGMFLLPPSGPTGAAQMCEVPSGTPVGISVSGGYCTHDDVGNCTLESLDLLSVSELIVNDEPIDISAHRYDTGEFDIELAEDNVVGEPAGPAVARASGDFVVLLLDDGEYTLKTRTVFDATDEVPEYRGQGTYEVTVG